MPSSLPTIRLAEARDIPALYDICLRTANAGTDASALYSDPHYPGLLYAVPYAIYEPQLAYVLAQGEVTLGYVVATRNSDAFEKCLDEQWWPPLVEKMADREPQLPLDSKVLDFIRRPQHKGAALTERYPAHLHINLLPQVQGGGYGRQLIEKELEALRRAGVSGVHLGVSLKNEKVCAFYQRLGFKFLHRDQAIYMGQLL